MSDRLKTWTQWKRLEKDVDEDTMLMVEDIENLFNKVASFREALEFINEIAPAGHQYSSIELKMVLKARGALKDE